MQEALTEGKPNTKISPLKRKINAIHQLYQKETSFDNAWQAAEKHMFELLRVEDLRIYKHAIYNPEIVAQIKTGSDVKEVRHLLSPASIAGFTALTQQLLMTDDIRDDQKMASVHPQLKYNQAYDNLAGIHARAILSVPILHENAVLGVFQAVNPLGTGGFSDQDASITKALAAVMAQKIRSELNMTKGPFDFLISQGKLTADQLERLSGRARREKKWTSQLLRTELDIDPEEIGYSLEKYYQVPFQKYDPSMRPPESLVKGISRYFLKSRLWVPIKGNPDKVVIMISDPRDRAKVMEIQKLLNAHSYEFRVGLPEDILAYLGKDKPGPGNPKGFKKAATAFPLKPSEIKIETDFDGIGSEASKGAIQYVNQIIAESIRLGASDIHVEPAVPFTPAEIRMRVDGVCRKSMEVPYKEIASVVSRIKILSGLDISERRKPQDGKAKIKLQGKDIEIRVATLPTINGESVVMRLLASSGAMPFEKLNLSVPNAEAIQRLIEHPHGIFLVVGPTGSGKTTTLHAILGKINTPERKIWTAEDPVEITQPGLQQVQVLHKIGLDFASVMRSFLRADPDVILIGEMRDFETANIGIESSLTGHLVFSTLHTNSAPETVIRLLDLGLDPFNFSDAILGILAQRLVRTLCSDCKEPYKPTDDEYELLVNMYGSKYFDELAAARKDIILPKPVGCENCGNTGYHGRTGLHELLVATEAIKRLISTKAAVKDLRNKATEEGMRTLIQDGVAKILKGDTDIKQLHRVAAG